MYKLPIDVGPKKDSTGFEFLYCDSESSSGLKLSKISLDHEQSAFGLTLEQVFKGNPDAGYVLWNDEIPPTDKDPDPKDKGGKGHSKGVLGFNKKTDTGFYLLHSTPRFPAAGVVDLPNYEIKYGQTYLCVGLKDYRSANEIAEILRTQNEAQVYGSLLPNIDESESIAKLAKNDNSPVGRQPAQLEFETPNGCKFLFIAKNKRWSEPPKGKKVGKDFWKDLIGPALDCDLNVETWRRGTVFGDFDTGSDDETLDVVDVDLEPLGLEGYKWAFTHDHAKWGISVNREPGYVIIADINRQVSQGKRGGGGLAFKDPKVWEALKSIEILEKQVELGPHTDKA